MTRSIKELAAEAIQIQDACDPLDLSKAYAEALQELADNLRAEGKPADTPAIRNHPINRLWIAKMHDLANLDTLEIHPYVEALHACEALAKSRTLPKDLNLNLYEIVATIAYQTTNSDDVEIQRLRKVPSFLLDADQLCITDAIHAQQIAREIISPLVNQFELKMATVYVYAIKL